jgi:hypothetical protein
MSALLAHKALKDRPDLSVLPAQQDRPELTALFQARKVFKDRQDR